jgi:transcriptional regulator with XRE-family HTH domain
MDGMKLREMRLKLGMTQAELAEALEVPQATISRWENAKHDMDHPAILKLAMEHLRCKRRTR